MKIIVTSRITELTGPRSEWLGGTKEDEVVVGNMNWGKTLVRFGKEKERSTLPASINTNHPNRLTDNVRRDHQ